MPSLAKIQQDFGHFARGHGSREILPYIKPSSLPSADLLEIYHNNIITVHRRSLQNDYPLVFSIMGAASSRAMARAYVEANFPCTAPLCEWGGGLFAFIQRYEPAAIWPYLADIAQYEWAKHLAYEAAERVPLTSEDMKELIERKNSEPTFQFQPSCQLRVFSYPLEAILTDFQKNQSLPSAASQEPAYALILKCQGIIKVYWLTPALFAFMNRLKEGQDSEVAFAAARVLDPDFDAQLAFQFLLSNPILCR